MLLDRSLMINCINCVNSINCVINCINCFIYNHCYKQSNCIRCKFCLQGSKMPQLILLIHVFRDNFNAIEYQSDFNVHIQFIKTRNMFPQYRLYPCILVFQSHLCIPKSMQLEELTYNHSESPNFTRKSICLKYPEDFILTIEKKLIQMIKPDL